MKILFILRGFVNGGVERRAVNLANEFAARGHIVEVAAFQGKCFPPVFETAENVSFYFSGDTVKPQPAYKASAAKGDKNTKTAHTANPKKSKHGVKRIINIIKKRLPKSIKKKKILRNLYEKHNVRLMENYFSAAKPDVIITFKINLLPYVLSAAENKDFKVFFALTNAHQKMSLPLYSRKNGVFDLLKQTDGVIAQTKSEKEFYEKELNNVTVIHNPLKLGLPSAYVGEREKTIVSFCRIAPQKNLGLLVDAFELFHSQHPEYSLLIYGDTVDENEKEYLRKLLAKIGEKKLDNCVSVLPFCTDIHDKVRNCAMFVSSSDYEGLSNSMLEAMAIGLPCICTDCMGGGTREVMTDRENGLIVPMNDAEAMCRAMKEFAENPGLTGKCSLSAAKIREELSVEKIALQWLEVIEK